MRTVVLASFAALAAAGVLPAQAQTSAPPKEAIRGFVNAYAGAAPAMGKIARWTRGICPITAGLPKSFNAQVTQRVREIAAQVGAPVAPATDTEPCRPNIDIVFALQPQNLLDDIRKRQPVYLGYHDMAQATRIATVRYPVQAWYATETHDLHGMKQVDYPWASRGVRLHRDYFAENAKDARVQANRLGDGLQSDFYHVVIVVDLHKVNGQEIEPLADQIAVLALSQPRSFDTCLTPASITNLLSPGCEAKAKAVTAVDLAYLRGLYDVDTGTNFVQQRGQIADLMVKGLGGN